MKTISLHYTEQQIKETIRAYFLRQIGLMLPLVSALLAVFLLYRLIQGDRSWYVGLLTAIVVLVPLLLFSFYIIHLRRSLERLNRMNSPVAEMEISSDHFRIQSDVGATEMKWSHVRQVQRFPLAWLIFFSGIEFLTLPLEGLSEETKQYILSVAESNGAKIT